MRKRKVALVSGKEVLISGLAGDATISTVNGDVVVDGVTSDIHINGVSGEVAVRNHEGAITVRTISGDITGTPNSVRVSTVSGRLQLDNAEIAGVHGGSTSRYGELDRSWLEIKADTASGSACSACSPMR